MIYNVYVLQTTQHRIEVEAEDTDEAVTEAARLWRNKRDAAAVDVQILTEQIVPWSQPGAA